MQLLLIILLLLNFGMNTEAQQINPAQIQTGDLLFRETASSNLSQAIDQVTQTQKQTHFSHVGLAIVENDSVHVLHASPIGGTCSVSLTEFSMPDGDSAAVTVYRLQEAYQAAVPNAVSTAKSLLGKPYNFSYVLSDTSHYCSEFIYLAFAEDSIFALNPMTFKNPVTGEFDATWVKHYEKLTMEIPEGLPGCNPNGMAASDKLKRLGMLQRTAVSNLLKTR
jgi:cell wall-associated NlpC family hydrolase